MNEIYSSTDKAAPNDRQTAGPFDVSEIQDARPFIDFGSLRVPARSDMALRVEIEDASGQVVAVSIDIGGSSIQVQAFAAPRSEGLWHTLRAELEQSVSAQGGEVERRVGSLGQELLARVPVLDSNGVRSGTRSARFVGVDGPRWFLRGLVAGAAINDPRAAAEIDDVFRSLIVVRDNTPLPPRDLLPLKVPGGTVAPPRATQ